MGRHRISICQPIPSAGIRMLLLQLFILSSQVMEIEAVWGWFGGNSKQKSAADSGGFVAQEVPRDAAFDLDSLQVLGGTVRGKELYDQSTSLMAGHTCWQKAYGGMRTNCRDILNDETKKSRLALRLTDCFLMSSGRPGLKNCPNNAPVVSCVRLLDDHNHKIFLAFFVDVAAMCHHLQSEDFKLETEKAVKLLKDSAHKTQDKLDTMNIHLDAQHSQVVEHTGLIIEAQEILQKGHDALQASIQEGMGRIQESSDHVRSGLDDVHDMQKDVARQHEVLAEVMATELNDLQHKSNALANSLGSLYGTVEDLAEQSKAGRQQAIQGLTDIQALQQEAREKSKQDLTKLSHETLKVYDAYRSWQAQLGGAHEQLVLTASEITKNHDTILTKQSQVNELIMEVLEALMSLQKGWMFESRLVRSVAIYVGTSITIYIATTTKKTRSARLVLYLGLFVVSICEMYIIRFGVEDAASKEGPTGPPSKLAWLRYTYFAVALAFLLYTFLTYTDYKVLNHKMLAKNVDLMNNLVKEMKVLAERQGNVEEALGIAKEVGEEKTQKRTRFTVPRKQTTSKGDGDRRRSHTSPF